MVKVVRVPALGEQKQTQTLLNQWYVRPGEAVAAGADLAELVTDKAAFNLPAPEAGRVARLLAAEGATVQEGDVLAELEIPGGA